LSQAHERVANLPCWKGIPRLSPLHGGLSTTSFLVEDDAGRHVARFGADIPAHHVSRSREKEASLAAAQAGLSPPVLYAAPDVLVIAYIEGRTFTEADMRARPADLAHLLRKAHTDVGTHLRGPANAFWVFHVIRDYAASLKLPQYADLATRLEARQTPLPVVFGHHDLLPGNILDDGNRLWLIDWEYAGFGTAMFDLANASANGNYDAATDQTLLTSYWGHAPSDHILQSFAAMKLASNLREALWAKISALHLAVPGADYETHARDYLARTDHALSLYTQKYGTP
jgi:thiamine kinase-like enzyme